MKLGEPARKLPIFDGKLVGEGKAAEFKGSEKPPSKPL